MNIYLLKNNKKQKFQPIEREKHTDFEKKSQKKIKFDFRKK
jgi:hypothetical protein